MIYSKLLCWLCPYTLNFMEATTPVPYLYCLCQLKSWWDSVCVYIKQLVCQYLLAIITFVEHWSHLFLFICVSLAIVVSVCYNTPHTTTQSQTDAVHFSSAHFGAGIGPIHMSNVDCNGRESNLIECSRSSTVNCTNGHSEDAGVRCQGNFIQCYCRSVLKSMTLSACDTFQHFKFTVILRLSWLNQALNMAEKQQLASYPGPTQQIRKGTWSHLQTISYVTITCLLWSRASQLPLMMALQSRWANLAKEQSQGNPVRQE